MKTTKQTIDAVWRNAIAQMDRLPSGPTTKERSKSNRTKGMIYSHAVRVVARLKQDSEAKRAKKEQGKGERT